MPQNRKIEKPWFMSREYQTPVTVIKIDCKNNTVSNERMLAKDYPIRKKRKT